MAFRAALADQLGAFLTDVGAQGVAGTDVAANVLYQRTAAAAASAAYGLNTAGANPMIATWAAEAREIEAMVGRMDAPPVFPPAKPQNTPKPAGGTAANDSSLDEVQLDALARAILAEARGEPYDGQVAVAAVIINRAKRLGQTPRDQVFYKQPHGAYYLSSVADQNRFYYHLPITDPRMLGYDTARHAAIDAAAGRQRIGTRDHFYAKTLKPPYWAKNTIAIGSQWYFNE